MYSLAFLSRVPIKSSCATFTTLSKQIKTTNSLKKYSRNAILGSLIGGFAYDAYNDFELYGGASRFLRSLKIAAHITIDYTWNLYGVNTNTADYEQVRNSYDAAFLAFLICEF